MAVQLRHTMPGMSAMVTAINAAMVRVGAGSNFHCDASEMTITAANASDLATSLALTQNLIGVLLFHSDDALAHKQKDATLKAAVPAISTVVDLASAITAANAMKAAYNVHRASTTFHYNADATNTITSADATDQASLNTLLNQMKTQINAHMASAPAGSMIRLVSA